MEEHDLPTAKAWEKIGYYHHHGIAFPLSALRNPKGSGIGDFLDLIPMIEWCRSTGFDVIQLLPLNDSGGDPSPYSAHSATALHPIYLSLSALPSLELFPELASKLEKTRKYAHYQRVAYHKILHHKEQFMRSYFLLTFPLIKSWPAFTTFVHENPWLEGYALYKVLKEIHQEKPWWEWEDEVQNPTVPTLQALKERYKEEINFHLMVQFLCFDQFKQVKECADKEGLFLKGDIPILINRDSADVWLNRDLFLLDFAAGAPPDMYGEEGQYWGFPIYDWDRMEKEDYKWWKTRLQVAEKLYHLYRLDHIVGFFKIWAIPLGKTAKEGFFLPQDERLWIPQGERILRAIVSSCELLPIGEDLGAVPPSVKASLAELGICGTKVMRWERKWDEDKSFIDPSEYPPLSMSCLSTHDSETMAEWWQNEHADAKLFCDSKGLRCPETLDFTTRKWILEECHASSSLFHINLLQEYLGLFKELSWPNPDDDRINIPGLVLDRNWTYRFRPTIDQIITHKGLAEVMTELA